MGSYRRTRRRGAQSRRRTDRRRTDRRRTGRRTYRRRTGRRTDLRRTYRRRRVSQRKGRRRTSRRRTSRRRTSRRYQMRGGAENLLAGQFYMDVVRDDRDRTRLDYSPPARTLMIMQMIGAKIDTDENGDYWKYYCRVIQNYGPTSPNLVNKYFGFRYSQLTGATWQPISIPCNNQAGTQTKVIRRMEKIITQGHAKHKLGINYDIPLSRATDYFTVGCPDLQVMYGIGTIASRGRQREAFLVPKRMEHAQEQDPGPRLSEANPRTSTSSGPEFPQQEVSPFTSPQIQEMFNEIPEADSQTLSEREKEIDEYQKEIQQIEEIENAMKSAETERLEKQIDEKLRQIQRHNARIKILQLKISSRTDAIDYDKDALAQQETVLRQLEIDASELRHVLTGYREEQQNVKDSMAEIQKKIDGLITDISGNVGGVGTSDQGVQNIDVKSALLEEVKAYEKASAEHKNKLDVLSDQIKVQEDIQTALITQMKSIVEDIKQRKTNITDATQGIEKKTQQVEGHQSRIQESKNEIGNIAGDLEPLVSTSNASVTGAPEVGSE